MKDKAFKLFFYFTLVLYSSLQADGFYRDDAKEVVIDTADHLMWQDDMWAAATEKSFEEAKTYCANLDFAGYQDWRLPDLATLKNIVRADNYPRAIVKEFQNVASDYYWSSSAYNDLYAWMVLFIYEDAVYYHKSEKTFVRCVRSMK